MVSKVQYPRPSAKETVDMRNKLRDTLLNKSALDEEINNWKMEMDTYGLFPVVDMDQGLIVHVAVDADKDQNYIQGMYNEEGDFVQTADGWYVVSLPQFLKYLRN